jgi:hypothetical protein
LPAVRAMDEDFYTRLKRFLPRKKKGSPALELAAQIITAVYPEGVPGDIRNRDLFYAAQHYCTDQKLKCPSDTHLLRAVGRRK